MARAYYVYTIQPHDVGRRILPLEGKQVVVEDFMGAVQVRDVGKRIYKSGGVYQIENDEQVEKRMRTKGNPKHGPGSYDYDVQGRQFSPGEVVVGFGLHNAGRYATIEKVQRGSGKLTLRTHLDNRMTVQSGRWWRIVDVEGLQKMNPPLKDVRVVGSNMTEAHHGLLHILYSYHTPVAIMAPSGLYKTSTRHSVTTSKHINQWLSKRWNLDPKGARAIEQSEIAACAEAGRDPGTGKVFNNPRKLRSSGRRGKVVGSFGSPRKIARAKYGPTLRQRSNETAFQFRMRQAKHNPAQPSEGPGQNIRNALAILWAIEQDVSAAAWLDIAKHIQAADARLRVALRQVESGVRGNPLAIYGANPSRGARVVSELGRVIDIRYKRKDDGLFYKHPFKKRPRLLALSDGTIAVRP